MISMTQQNGCLDTELFRSDPCRFLDDAIREHVRTSPLNHLTAFGNLPIVDEPIVGFADGDDPVFQELKTVIGEFHMTPREVLDKHIAEKRWRFGAPGALEKIGVVSWALPLTYETRLRERSSPLGGSPMYNHSRWIGIRLYEDMEQFVASLLEVLGCNAVAPVHSKFFAIQNMPGGWMAANWSERHVAYACGLGTFGLNGLMITTRGCAVYLGSAVVDRALTPTRRAASRVANRPYFTDRSCGLCIERCPGKAIGPEGRRNVDCLKNLRDEQAPNVIRMGLDKGLVGPAPACGRCSTGLPCEDRIPAAASARNA